MSVSTMDTSELSRIVRATTTVYRTGEVVEAYTAGSTTVIEINNYPPATDARKAVVDMVFISVEVDGEKAEPEREALRVALGNLVGPETGFDWRQGPSYIHIGADLDSQETALRLMALCSVMGIGELMGPKQLGVEGAEARSMAGSGFLYLVKIDPAGVPYGAVER